MASFGEHVTYDGLVYQIVAVSADAEPTYTLEPVRRNEDALTRVITSSQLQMFLVPSGGDRIASVAGSAIEVIGSRTAVATALAEGYVRVKFDSQGGTAVVSQIIAVDAKATAVSAPTKTHYSFVNWYYNAAGTGDAVNFSVDTFDDDTTLYAKWAINTFTVTYDSNEGSAVEAETVDYGEAATEPDDPAYAGHLFAGWYTDDSTFLLEYDFATLVTANITLYAKWDVAVTVTFDSNGGSAVDAQVIASGALATEPEDPVLVESTFSGWFYDDDTFLDDVVFDTDVFTADDTLYAKWV